MKAIAATFTTIALAAASLSAQAQSSVQLTGTVDAYVGSVKMAGQEIGRASCRERVSSPV